MTDLDAPAPRTPHDIEKLKQEWRQDPVWDIEHTEGFAAQQQELALYATECRRQWELDRLAANHARAAQLGCGLALADYIFRLENRIQCLEERFDATSR